MTATQRDTGFSRAGKTDAAGAYSFANMPLGRYDVKIEREGFKTKVVGPVTLIVDQKLAPTWSWSWAAWRKRWRSPGRRRFSRPTSPT